MKRAKRLRPTILCERFEDRSLIMIAPWHDYPAGNPVLRLVASSGVSSDPMANQADADDPHIHSRIPQFAEYRIAMLFQPLLGRSRRTLVSAHRTHAAEGIA
jgi:hypothetical protein